MQHVPPGGSDAGWDRVEALFDAALDLDADARDAFIERECRGDAALLERLAALLHAAGSAGDFLERPASELAADLVEEIAAAGAAPGPPFERVGAYRLIDEIGRGGMGAVYTAERDDDQYRRRVAVKLVRPGGTLPELAARFRTERQILASLEHPNIARLHDGGLAADGSPYLVMEYIRGRRLDVYCDEERLSITARLQLFDALCAAVQFAHQNLVVHRDIKPGNVLVTDDGTVKLLDFGVARLLDADAAAATTRLGARPLTPEYASPEQVRGAPVSTAADVYALGVLLCELLAGQRPHDFSRASPLEIERTLTEREPDPPSVALQRPRTPPATRAAGVARLTPGALRATTDDGLRRQLRGDLDAIVLTAIHREPQRRYPSVQHLRDDIRRHLRGLPVTARLPTWRYRTAKFVRRQRLALATAAVLLLSLFGGAAGTLWQARAAALEARRAEQVRDFVVGLFRLSDPDESQGRTITARELLERGAHRLDDGLAAEPALRADLLGVVGQIYRELGMYQEARPLLEEALAVRQAIAGPRPVDVVRSGGSLTNLLYLQGEYDGAERLARETLERARSLRAGNDSLVAAALGNLAAVLSVRADHDAAATLLTEALAIDRRLDDREALATHLDNLGVLHWRAARYDEAVTAHEEALSIRRAVHGNAHTATANSLLNLATATMERGDYARAETLLRETLDLRLALLGEAHPDVARTFNNIGEVLTRQGRLEEGEQAHRRALQIRRQALGDEHPDVANSLNNLAVVLYMMGRYADAADHFELVLPLWRAALGDEHPHVLTALSNLGAARRSQGDYAAGERALREALSLRRKVFGDEHPAIASSLNNLAGLMRARGDPAEAEVLHREAITMWRSTLGDGHPDVAFGLVDLGRLVLEQGRAMEAEPLLAEGVRIREASLAAESPLLASARLFFAESLLALGRAADAGPLFAASLPVLRDRWGDDNDLTLRAARGLDATR